MIRDMCIVVSKEYSVILSAGMIFFIIQIYDFVEFPHSLSLYKDMKKS